MNPNSIHYHSILADYFSGKPLYLDEPTQKKPCTRKLVELPFQQTIGEMWDEVTETLCDLNFIQAKCAAQHTFDLVNDYNVVLESIPDNADYIRTKKERQSRLDKYAKDLVLFSKGEINELEVPESITPWSDEKSNAEIARINTNPGRADSLRDFYNFLGHEIDNLQKYAREIPRLATQQAWNHANSGTVAKAAEKGSPEIYNNLLLRTSHNRPPFNHFPQTLKTLKGHTSMVFAVSITPDGRRAVSGSYDCLCILWDLHTGEALKTLEGHTKQVNAVAITPDGKMTLSGTRNGDCILSDLESGMLLKTLIAYNGSVNAVVITPDGKMALSGSSDGTCILWDLENGKILKTLKGHTERVWAVAITPDGKMALSGSRDKTCILWDLENGKILKTLEGHTKQVNAVAITPDGRRAVSGSNDCICILWDLNTGETLKTLKGHTGHVKAVAITPDGKMALSGSYDMTCIIWDLESAEKRAQFFTTSNVFAIKSFPRGIVGGNTSGETFILHAHRELLCPGIGIITARQIWDFELYEYQTLTADCPLCGHRFTPPETILTTIDTITKKAGLKPRQSPCLELPKEAWEEPGLLGKCPKCEEKLRFNPFTLLSP